METPITLRFTALCDASNWNSLSAFHPTWAPTFYAPGYGLPFATRITGAQNNTNNRNTAIAYSFYRTFQGLLPRAAEVYIRPVLVQMGLDPDYTSRTNLTDPRDVGNAAGAAVAAYAVKDGYNMLGDIDNPDMPQPYSDYTKFVPTNTAYKLADITRWVRQRGVSVGRLGAAPRGQTTPEQGRLYEATTRG